MPRSARYAARYGDKSRTSGALQVWKPAGSNLSPCRATNKSVNSRYSGVALALLPERGRATYERVKEGQAVRALIRHQARCIRGHAGPRWLTHAAPRAAVAVAEPPSFAPAPEGTPQRWCARQVQTHSANTVETRDRKSDRRLSLSLFAFLALIVCAGFHRDAPAVAQAVGSSATASGELSERAHGMAVFGGRAPESSPTRETAHSDASLAGPTARFDRTDHARPRCELRLVEPESTEQDASIDTAGIGSATRAAPRASFGEQAVPVWFLAWPPQHLVSPAQARGPPFVCGVT